MTTRDGIHDETRLHETRTREYEKTGRREHKKTRRREY